MGVGDGHADGEQLAHGAPAEADELPHAQRAAHRAAAIHLPSSEGPSREVLVSLAIFFGTCPLFFMSTQIRTHENGEGDLTICFDKGTASAAWRFPLVLLSGRVP